MYQLMKLKTNLVASLIALATSSAFAGEFFENGPLALLTQNGIEQGQGTSVVFPPAYGGTAGQFTGTYGGGADSFLRFFCIEFQPAGAPAAYSLSSSPSAWSAGTYSNLQKLYDLYYPTHGQVDFYNGGNTNFGVFNSATDAAAFQLAVWEIVEDNNLDLATGGFTGNTNPYSGQAQGYLNAVAGYAGSSFNNWTVYRFSNPTQQDFVTATLNVPEPGSLALAGLALAGLGLISRRRR